MKTLLPFWTKGKLVQFTDASRLRWRYILTFKNNELRLYMLEHFVLPPPPSDIIDPLEDIFFTWLLPREVAMGFDWTICHMIGNCAIKELIFCVYTCKDQTYRYHQPVAATRRSSDFLAPDRLAYNDRELPAVH